MKTALALLGFALLPSAATAESLQILVLEVDRRLVGPTYDRAVDGTPEALEEAITKMRLLAPDKGVRILLDLDVERNDPKNLIETKEMKYVDDPKGTSRRYEIGHQHRWSRLTDVPSRDLKLHLLRNADSLHRHSFSFHHHLTERWSLSAGTATPDGAVFVFEKLSEPDPKAVPARWILSTLHEPDRNKPKPGSPRERLTNPPLGRSAIIRLPDNRSLAARAESDYAVHNGYARGFSSSSTTFLANNTSSSAILKRDFPPRAGLKLVLLTEEGPASQVTHSGETFLPLDPTPGIAPFETVHRDEIREDSTTRSVPSKDKPEYFLEGHLLPPPKPR